MRASGILVTFFLPNCLSFFAKRISYAVYGGAFYKLIFVCMFVQVHPEDVMDPSSPGPIFILVDCPTAEYIPALLSNPVLSGFQEQNSSKQVTLIVHISPASVSGLPEYQSWMSGFGRAQHVMAGHGT